MSFDAVGRYAGTHRPWDHAGNVIPEIEHSEGIRPAFPFKVAPYLPVQFKDKYDEDWYVIMPGKLVALDPAGWVVPAYLATATTIAYTANDVLAGTIDIRTGDAVTAAATVTLSQVDGSTYGFMGRQGVAFYDSANLVSAPIGVAPYAYYQWAGDGGPYDDGWNPAGYRYHNYNRQHQVAVLCDAVIKLPLVPGQCASETLTTNWSNSAVTFGTKAWKNRTYLQATARYDASTGYLPVLSTDTVIGLVLDNYPVAKNSINTPITSNVSGLLVTEVDSISAVTAAGYFFVDYPMGVVFVYSADGASLPTVTAASTVTYFHYATAPSVYSVFACVLSTTSELVPGDFVGVAVDSNFTRLAVTASTLPTDIVGQVLGFEVHPQDALDRVKTAFSPVILTDASGSMSNATAGSDATLRGHMDRMPGSATGGMPDAIHYSGASNTFVVINLIGR